MIDATVVMFILLGLALLVAVIAFAIYSFQIKDEFAEQREAFKRRYGGPE